MPNLLTKLRITEVSLVESPANKGARAVLVKADFDDDEYVALCKRTFSAEERRQAARSGAAMPGGGYPIKSKQDLKNAIQAFGRAKDKAKTKAHIISRARSLGATSMLPEGWVSKDDGDAETYDEIRTEQNIRNAIWAGMDALRQACMSILGDDTVDDKASMVAESVNQFRDEIVATVGKSAEDVDAVLRPEWEKVSKTIKGMEVLMPKTVAELEAEIAKMKADGEDNALIAKMSDAEKEHCKGMTAEQRKTFMAMAPAERTKAMKKSADDKDKADEVFKGAGGVEIRKSVVGEAVFAVMKAQHEENAKLMADLAKSEETRRTESIEKQLRDGGVVEAVAKEQAPAIRALQISNSAAADTLIKGLLAAAEQTKKADEILKTPVGSNAPKLTGGKAYDQLVAKAQELRKAEPKLSFEQAFSKVYADRGNAQLVALHKSERGQAQ